MSVTNIYEYLVHECGDILSMLTCDVLDGGKKQCFSDYEKFRAVCEMSVRLSGNMRLKSVNDALASCLGEHARACPEMCDRMWESFYKSLLYGESSCEPVLRSADELLLHIAPHDSGYIDIGDMTEFARPDVYHVNQARDKIKCGEGLSHREKNILAVQRMRDAAQSVGSGHITVTVGECPICAVTDAAAYIRREFPSVNIVAVLDADKTDGKTAELACVSGIAVGVFIRRGHIVSDIRRAADAFAIGNTILVPRECSAEDIKSAAGILMDEWVSEDTAYDGCRVKSKML